MLEIDGLLPDSQTAKHRPGNSFFSHAEAGRLAFPVRSGFRAVQPKAKGLRYGDGSRAF